MSAVIPTEKKPTNEDPPTSTKSRGGVLAILLNLAAVISLVLVALLVWARFSKTGAPFSWLAAGASAENAPPAAEASAKLVSIDLPSLAANNPRVSESILRKASLLTTIPERPEVEVVTYTVVSGDTLFSIADTFKIKPTTLLWGNYETLEDNPHLLKPGQVLNILPIDGTYYRWQKGDTVEKVAAYFGVEADAITSFTGNNIDLTRIREENSGITPDTWIIVPGGKRAIKDWGPPAITRSNPASARAYGPGACGAIYEGAVGTGSFLWPTTERFISGYNYEPGLHPAIDIAGQVGNAVYASDSGVVVYAGWSDFGYGYLIVIDHAAGWQTAYGHLSAVGVSCGQSVFRGGLIGAVGSTGNSTGSHLHFELLYNGAKLNPLDFLQ
ncbi:MAG: M23 family metallopeptidase [Anaerolineales bacterium]|nr:M23 family metallopeptidase [Anaerolineales bacterium]